MLDHLALSWRLHRDMAVSAMLAMSSDERLGKPNSLKQYVCTGETPVSRAKVETEHNHLRSGAVSRLGTHSNKFAIPKRCDCHPGESLLLLPGLQN